MVGETSSSSSSRTSHGRHLQSGGPGRQPQEVRRFIPGGVGRPTAEYLDRVLSRLTSWRTLLGAVRLSRPSSSTWAAVFFGGTSILIVVGVALDTVKQLEAQDDAQLRGGFLR